MVHPVAEITVQVKRLMTAWGGDTLSAKEILEWLGLKHLISLRNHCLPPAPALGWILILPHQSEKTAMLLDSLLDFTK